MFMKSLGLPARFTVLGAVVLALGAGVWAFTSSNRSAEAKVAVPKELTVDSLKAAANDRGKMMDTMRDAFRRDDLSDEQRHQVAQNMREVWQNAIDERLAEYQAAQSEQEKNKVLDKHLDEMNEWRKEFEKRRQEREREGQRDGERNDRGRGMFGPQSQQERKTASESRDPDKTAQRLAYFMALRNRAEQRGMQIPFGPGMGGRGTGPGSGPGRGSDPRGGSPRPDRGP